MAALQRYLLISPPDFIFCRVWYHNNPQSCYGGHYPLNRQAKLQWVTQTFRVIVIRSTPRDLRSCVTGCNRIWKSSATYITITRKGLSNSLQFGLTVQGIPSICFAKKANTRWTDWKQLTLNSTPSPTRVSRRNCYCIHRKKTRQGYLLYGMQ
jgi:hypothetical protein